MAPTVPIEFIGRKESKKCWLSQPMGKSKKFSKGHSSGFVPDFRHAVHTMAESEGFGSSGRVDTEMTASEMTASEDSCAPKRKCISLNIDCYDTLGVPSQVLSLSKMSRPERKDLEMRLKKELEQVRILQRKLASLSSNTVFLSPSSDIRSCSDGQKRPPLEGLHSSLEVSAPQSKKRAPPDRNRGHTKKGTSARSEPVKPAAPLGISTAMLMKQCEALLDRLMAHQFGWIFNTPVDVVKLNIPDYFTIIKHPMDLGTVKSKIVSGEYFSPLGFAADVRLTFSNAMKYNPPGNDVHSMAETLSKYFEVRWKVIEKKLPVTTGVESMPSRTDVHIERETTVHIERETTTSAPPLKKKKITPSDNKVKPEPVRRVMSNGEKQKLSMELEALLGELPESIIEFLKEHSGNAGQTGEDEIEIDIDTLGDDTLFNLRKLLDDYILEKQKNQSKAEPCEMEIINEPGISNSSLLPCKGNDTVEEDIDIVGGNDPPISSYPPIKIEKDEANKNSKRSSPSSSNSESGSSSSDSDSGSESGSESVAVKVSGSINVPKCKMEPGENVDQKRSDPDDSDVGNKSVDGLDQVELDTEGKPVAAEVDGHQEGESAPSKRQVSPEKLYRAALLRNRFADTILKAREKALEKGEKCDPEKLRKEKEEFERRQKEEKARLQAEAKAAEEARRKAEAEAAAEARRKRELEREAARQALLEMEKTVDINENSHFMEDLEMLRTVHDEQLPSFIEETSPDLSQNCLDSFKFQGSSNPLEQLGLYMKEDEDEEEEVVEPPPPIVPERARDVEEGEID
ncbi:PREDICTED: transcription factor GTE10 isoform X1 [Populus euphratica]|uniref:Transcription factor GTE10 isoform X1 n=1 Tax=Populus euphratica TaxID=75702 RepID=A0AAJ6XM68_POPEU|nr:PREDICTED: transcription factor GTE10 isoform X1 [Populus euphratica]